jgi:hypothetical protein
VIFQLVTYLCAMKVGCAGAQSSKRYERTKDSLKVGLGNSDRVAVEPSIVT